MSTTTSNGKHRASGPARTPSSAHPGVGTDGLTAAHRRRLRVRFRQGMGFRPDPDEFVAQADLIADKLAGSARRDL